MAYNLTPWWFPGYGQQSSSTNNYGTSSGSGYTAGTSQQQAVSNQQSSGVQGSTSTGRTSSQQSSSTYIPEYSQTPILENIAKYAANMAPQVYQWGMDQYNKNQGNIDSMLRDATSYSSPQRIAQEMGQAQSGVMQGAEQGRQNAVRDLQSYGIDPSSGRYAALDTANRTMAGAMAAGAGNQQRMATEATGIGMRNQALSASMQNQQVGYGAANAANQLLGTGMSLKYSPLGTVSQGTSDATQDSSSYGSSQSTGSSASSGSSANIGQNETSSVTSSMGSSGPYGLGGVGGYGSVFRGGGFGMVEGGFVPDEISKSGGGAVDDVPANLTAGEFIIPKDIVEWKGQEFFYKLMAQTRKMRATSGSDDGGDGGGEPAMGYGAA